MGLNVSEPQLGDEYSVEMLFFLGKFEQLVDVAALSQEWTCILKERFDPSEALVGNAWIYRIEDQNKTVYLTRSRFGVYPISDRMRPRYVRAVRAVLDVLAGAAITPEVANSISEVKGMYNRILRGDQWDWFSVYKALDRPSTSDASRIVDWLVKLRAEGILSKTGELQSFLASGPLQLLRTGLQNALVYLEETYRGLPGGRLLSVAKEKGVKKDLSRKVCVNYDAIKTERASAAHLETLSVLNAFLGVRGFRVESNIFVDAFSRLRTGPAFFEIKSISEENELDQARRALSQLYEYRFRHGLNGATLWIVLSGSPQIPWLTDYLIRDREVFLLWIKNGILTGHSLDALTAMS